MRRRISASRLFQNRREATHQIGNGRSPSFNVQRSTLTNMTHAENGGERRVAEAGERPCTTFGSQRSHGERPVLRCRPIRGGADPASGTVSSGLLSFPASPSSFDTTPSAIATPSSGPSSSRLLPGILVHARAAARPVVHRSCREHQGTCKASQRYCHPQKPLVIAGHDTQSYRAMP
jgi:hypothetical protein